MIDVSAKHIWRPYTQMKTAPSPLEVVATSGSRLCLADGRWLIDGVASWWTACHGYNHPHIIDSMKKQLDCMPHVMFGGLTHQPAQRLAARLAAMAPGDLNHVFFVDSGSVAVEVALKMAVQYWLNKSIPGRNKFVHFRHGYHGDTTACMALCDPDEGMHAHFKDYLPQHILAELPHDINELNIFDELLRREKGRLAAVIIEPLVQGAGGMKLHSADILRGIADICVRHEVLLIVDEIFTGFGRTGTMFACEQAGVVPDIMCVGKALTGGTVTLAATLARTSVFEMFWSDDPKAALMHGPTYMANPLACSAANASLDLFETEPRLQQVQMIEALLRGGLEPCRSLVGVIDVRVKGAIGVVQLQALANVAGLKQKFVDRNVWVRPFGDIIYLTPALTISQEELAVLTSAVCEIVETLGD